MPGAGSIPDQLVAALRQAQRVAVLTGAGVSAESGVPTFRDAQTGLWAKYHPEDLATPQAFRKDPKLVWAWYSWRRELVSRANPNPGHQALAAMESSIPDFTLITQNVDGLHQRAGSQNVIELHGNIFRNKCSSEDQVVEALPETGALPPRCPNCGDLLRPDVVWFGEELPQDAIQLAWEAARRCQVFLVVGTSGIVQPAASLPLVAAEAGATLVEINPVDTPITPLAKFILRGQSGAVLPALLESVWRNIRTA